MAETYSSSRYLRLLSDQPSDKAPMDCYICIQIAQRKHQLQQDGPSKTCLLCNNPFCENHKGSDEGVCEIGHEKYYSNPAHRARHAPVKIFPSLAERQKKLGAEGMAPAKVSGPRIL